MNQPVRSFRTGFALSLFFIFLSCQRPGKCARQVEQAFKLDGFRGISASDNFLFYIYPAKQFSVKAKGCADDLADLAFSISDSLLDIRFKKYRSERYQIHFEVYTPVGSEIRFFKTPRVRITVGPKS